MGEAIVVLLCRFDLPAHDKVHDEYYGDLFWHPADVGEGAQDVGEESGQRVGFYDAVGEDEGGEVGVVWADERLYGYALCCAVLAVLEELE